MSNSEKHLELVQNEYNELLRLKTLGYFVPKDLESVNYRISELSNEIHMTKSWINIDFLTAKK